MQPAFPLQVALVRRPGQSGPVLLVTQEKLSAAHR